MVSTQEQHFPWDSRQQGHILSAFFYGYITTFLGGYVGHRLGGNLVNLFATFLLLI